MSTRPLADHSVLLVEDNPPDARRFARLLRNAGAHVAGPVDTIQGALELIAASRPSAAWLDVWIGDDDAPIWPVADRLAGMGVPFFFCTNFTDKVDRRRWPGRPVVRKHLFSERALAELVAMLAAMIEEPAAAACLE